MTTVLIIKNEMFYGYEFSTLDELKDAMEEYIHYYNNRIQKKLKG